MPTRREWPRAVLLLGACLCASAHAGPEEDYQRGLAAYQAEDLMTAMEALGPPAEAGYPPALVLLGYILDKADEDAQAVALYRRAADGGDPAGMVGLAGMYVAGEGVERDQEAALALYRGAAEQGYGPAMIILAQNYLSGGLGLPPDRDLAIRWLERAVAAGHEPARAELERLRNG